MFVLVMGVAGSGKTTIGALLADRLGWPFFDADDFHPPDNVRKMASGTPLTDEDRRPWLEKLSSLIADHSRRGQSGVLACSALKNAYRNILSAETDLVVVYLKATPELARSRLTRRRGHFMPARLIESQFADLEEPMKKITVDAAWSPEQSVAAVLAQLER